MPASSLPIAPALALSLALTAPGFGQTLVPLTDLAFPYLGAGEPGLYPGGSNEPTGAHLAAGLARSTAVTPRSANGNPSADGLVGVALLGISNTNQEGARFEREADRRAEHAARVVLVDVAQGGISATEMDETSDSYWNLFDARLAAAGLSREQLQVVWLKSSLTGEATSGNFPERIESYRVALRGVVAQLAQRCPHLQLVFLSSRIWPAAATRATFAYEGGFAIQGVIQDQQNDVDGLGTGPWLGWGPYLWADGATPRLDGFAWLPGDLEADGVHPGPTAEWKVAQLLRAHFRTHVLTRDWYLPLAETALQPRDAVADAVVDPTQPGLADGAGTSLGFDSGRRIYLRFDLAGLAVPIVHAKLSLLVDAANLVGAADLHRVADDAWDEVALTWSSAPAIDLFPLTTVPNCSRGGAWSAGVTAVVEAARLAGEPAISFALVPAGGGSALASFLSRESGEPPRLVLTLDQPPGEIPIWSDGFESGDAWFWR